LETSIAPFGATKNGSASTKAKGAAVGDRSTHCVIEGAGRPIATEHRRVADRRGRASGGDRRAVLGRRPPCRLSTVDVEEVSTRPWMSGRSGILGMVLTVVTGAGSPAHRVNEAVRRPTHTSRVARRWGRGPPPTNRERPFVRTPVHGRFEGSLSVNGDRSRRREPSAVGDGR